MDCYHSSAIGRPLQGSYSNKSPATGNRRENTARECQNVKRKRKNGGKEVREGDEEGKRKDFQIECARPLARGLTTLFIQRADWRRSRHTTTRRRVVELKAS